MECRCRGSFYIAAGIYLMVTKKNDADTIP